MKYLVSISTAILMLISCSKEEDIPFKESIKDSIDVTSYRNISGVYEGIMTKITFISPTTYQKSLFNKNHIVTVSEINFDKVLIENVSTDFESNAEAEMFRYNQQGGFLLFQPYSMTDSTGPDSVINRQFNGRYYYANDSLSYFVYYIENSDTIHQLFEGKIK